MSTKTALIGIGVIILIAFGWWFFTTQPTESADNSANSETESQMNDQEFSQEPAGVRTVVSRGGNYTCSIETTGEDGKAEGTVYGAGNDLRVDFTAESDSGVNFTTHTIRKDGISYTWVEGNLTGTKTTVTTESPIVGSVTGGVIIGSDDATFASNCRAWAPDQELLTPPSQITFSWE